MVGLVKSERGAILVQIALMLPILMIIVVGAFEIWKIVNIKQALNEAAYEGVRVIAMHPNLPDAGRAAEALTRRYALRNPIVARAVESYGGTLDVIVRVGGRPLYGECEINRCWCGDAVEVAVYLSNYRVGQDLRGGRAVGPQTGWFSFLGLAGTLTASAPGRVLCETWRDPPFVPCD